MDIVKQQFNQRRIETCRSAVVWALGPVDECLLWKEWSLSGLKGWLGEGQPFWAGGSGDRPEWAAVSTEEALQHRGRAIYLGGPSGPCGD